MGLFSYLQIALILPALMAPIWADGTNNQPETSGLYRLTLTGLKTYPHITVNLEPGGLVFTALPDGRLALPLDNLRETVALASGKYRAEIISPTRAQWVEFEVTATSEKTIHLHLSPAPEMVGGSRTLETVNVHHGENQQNPGRETLTAAEARLMPGTGGDPVKAVMNLPGVVPQNFGSQDLVVRGSDGRDSRFALDGIRIGYPFHDMGFYSVFHPAALETVSFYPGAFSAAYGQAMGGIIDLTGKSSFDKNRARGEVDVNLASAAAFLTIPLGSVFQLSISGRRTYYEFYIDLVKSLPFPDLSPVKKALTAFDAIPFFCDYQVRLDAQLNAQNHLMLLGAGAKDRIRIQTDRFPDLAGGSQTFALSYEDMTQWDAQGISWAFDSPVFRSRLSIWRYDFTNLESFMSVSLGTGRTIYSGASIDQSLGTGSNLQFSWGLEALLEEQPFSVSLASNGASPPGFDLGSVLGGEAPAIHPALYTPRSFSPQRISLSPYTRAQLGVGPFTAEVGARALVPLTPGTPSLDPRFAIKWKPHSRLDIWLGGGRYSQAPELSFVEPGYGTPGLPNQSSLQGELGFKTATGPIEIKSVFYGKNMSDLVVANPTFDGLFPVSAETNPRFIGGGRGQSIGWETLVRTRPGGRLQGWLAYTISRSERSVYLANPDLSGGPQTNDGTDFQSLTQTMTFFAQDTTHALTLAGNVDLVPKKLRLGGRLVLATGKPYTDIIVTNYGGGYLGYAWAPLMEARYPTRFTFDLRLEFLFRIFGAEASIYIDTWNLQSLFRDNVQSYIYPPVSNLTPDQVGKPAPRTPVGDLPIVPLLGLTVKW